MQNFITFVQMVRYEYRLDRRAKQISFAVFGALAAGLTLLWLLSPTSWLPAWFSSVVWAVMVLLALSIPRSIRLTDDALEVRCVVEITQIPFRHIKEIRRAEWGEFRPFVPVFGSPGVMGWFGYWLQVDEWSMVKVYATRRTGLVLIEDIYEERYLLSCDAPEELIEQVEGRL